MQEKNNKKKTLTNYSQLVVFAWPSLVIEASCDVHYLSQVLGLLFVMLSLFILVYFLGSPKNFEVIQNNFYLFLLWKHPFVLNLIRTEHECYLALISDTPPPFLKLKSQSFELLCMEGFHIFFVPPSDSHLVVSFACAVSFLCSVICFLYNVFLKLILLNM